MSGSQGDIQDNTTSTFSVWVPGSAPSSTGNYFRLGSKDSNFENGTNLPNAAPDELPNPGALLYANGTVQVVAPEVDVTTTTWSAATLSESFSATYDGPLVVSASWQAPHVASVSYQALMEFNVNVTNAANLIVGNSLTYWAGNDASTGVGSLLWSNFGTTQNIFGGQIVNLINGGIDVQGWGEVKLLDDYTVDSTGTISLAVSPLAAGSTTLGNSLISKMNILATTLAVITGGITVAEAAGVGITLGEGMGIGLALDVKNNQTAVKDTMIATMSAVAAVETGVLVLQALAIAAGVSAKAAAAAATAASTASIEIENGSIILRVEENMLILSSTGMRIVADDFAFVGATFRSTAPLAQFVPA